MFRELLAVVQPHIRREGERGCVGETFKGALSGLGD